MSVTYRYKVTGIGVFPTDMLRYDEAFPASETDSGLLSEYRRQSGFFLQRRTIELRSHHAPTPERWISFGWKVLSVERR